MRTDRQIDLTKLIATLRNSAKATLQAAELVSKHNMKFLPPKYETNFISLYLLDLCSKKKSSPVTGLE